MMCYVYNRDAMVYAHQHFDLIYILMPDTTQSEVRSLHDALPTCGAAGAGVDAAGEQPGEIDVPQDELERRRDVARDIASCRIEHPYELKPPRYLVCGHLF